MNEPRRIEPPGGRLRPGGEPTTAERRCFRRAARPERRLFASVAERSMTPRSSATVVVDEGKRSFRDARGQHDYVHYRRPSVVVPAAGEGGRGKESCRVSHALGPPRSTHPTRGSAMRPHSARVSPGLVDRDHGLEIPERVQDASRPASSHPRRLWISFATPTAGGIAPSVDRRRFRIGISGRRQCAQVASVR
jgi:hypothetical protein